MDAVENCCQYISNFNPAKGTPFNYITTICIYAFWRRIHKEKTQLYTKYKMSMKATLGLDGAFSEQSGDDATYTLSSSLTEYSQEAMGNFIKEYEDAKQRKIDKKNAKNVEVVTEIPL